MYILLMPWTTFRLLSVFPGWPSFIGWLNQFTGTRVDGDLAAERCCILSSPASLILQGLFLLLLMHSPYRLPYTHSRCIKVVNNWITYSKLTASLKQFGGLDYIRPAWRRQWASSAPRSVKAKRGTKGAKMRWYRFYTDPRRGETYFNSIT